jgi:hypothetical protein
MDVFDNEVVTLLKEIREHQKYLDKKVTALGESCHTAFLQIKEAMQTLREELSESAGTMIDATWLD